VQLASGEIRIKNKRKNLIDLLESERGAFYDGKASSKGGEKIGLSWARKGKMVATTSAPTKPNVNSMGEVREQQHNGKGECTQLGGKTFTGRGVGGVVFEQKGFLDQR